MLGLAVVAVGHGSPSKYNCVNIAFVQGIQTDAAFENCFFFSFYQRNKVAGNLEKSNSFFDEVKLYLISLLAKASLIYSS